jgi:hypothetical protein
MTPASNVTHWHWGATNEQTDHNNERGILSWGKTPLKIEFQDGLTASCILCPRAAVFGQFENMLKNVSCVIGEILLFLHAPVFRKTVLSGNFAL